MTQIQLSSLNVKRLAPRDVHLIPVVEAVNDLVRAVTDLHERIVWLEEKVTADAKAKVAP